MTFEPVTLHDLEETRETMIAAMLGGMPDAHRRFLVSFKRGEPDWRLLGLLKVADLPAVKFRQEKLAALSAEVRAVQLERDSFKWIPVEAPVTLQTYESEPVRFR